MRVAIAGAGLAGLSVAYHLLQFPNVSVTVFDPKGIGGGASGVSTGLLHPFPGRLALKSWRADEGMARTAALLAKVEERSGRSVACHRGILRFALTEQQRRDFQKCVEFGCEWWPQERVLEKVSGAAVSPALWIPQGMTIYATPYLEGLWQLCLDRGAQFSREALCDEASFDRIVLAMGDKTIERVSLPIQYSITRGQALLCRWQERPPFSLLSQGHLTPSEHPEYCQIGSTYEDPSSLQDPKRALELREKIALFYPPAADFEVAEIRSGIRIARQGGYRPIIAQVDPKTWAFFGLGSRGLLYHALLGESLAKTIVVGEACAADR